MKIVNEDGLLLECEDGEEITVKVLSKNTKHLLTYVLDGEAGTLPEGKEIKFKLDKKQHDPSHLTLVLHFVSEPGKNGAYKVVITGDKGGDPLSTVYLQTFGIPVDSKRYTFDVW